MPDFELFCVLLPSKGEPTKLKLQTVGRRLVKDTDKAACNSPGVLEFTCPNAHTYIYLRLCADTLTPVTNLIDST